jgi:pimeloyl-ACP methyl ester carboxylesterase/class 3 adenylate cyclase
MAATEEAGNIASVNLDGLRPVAGQPQTRYARSGSVSLAYQVASDGPRDLVFVPGWVSNLETAWDQPLLARFLRRLASFNRLITFDKRGTGMSDRVAERELPTLEQRMDDVRAVMDAAGSDRAALFGLSEGASMAILFAATYPERTTALITFGAFACRIWNPEYPWAPTPEERQGFFDFIQRDWGGDMDITTLAPSMAGDEGFKRWLSTYCRLSASPGAALALARMNTEIDIRDVLSAIRVPTLILHRSGDLDSSIEEGRYIAARIPGAKFVELPGKDHLPYVGDQDGVVDEVEEFLTGIRPAPRPDRVLATVLFTDIVGSTERAAALGDDAWRNLLEQHHVTVRQELARYRGQEIATSGDGFFATFDGPARAVRCAVATRDRLRRDGIVIRAGIHTGECERMGDNIGGIAVHIGSRIAGLAAPGEVLASGTVKDLVAGSGIVFEDRGTHTLKGIPDAVRVFGIGG